MITAPKPPARLTRIMEALRREAFLIAEAQIVQASSEVRHTAKFPPLYIPINRDREMPEMRPTLLSRISDSNITANREVQI